MPVFQYIIEKDLYRAVIYKVTESLDFFLEKLGLSSEEVSYFSTIRHPGRMMDFLAVRYALHLALGTENRLVMDKDLYGKPFLPGHPLHISLSHSGTYVAAMASPYPCGLDIQRFDTKILKLENKFLNERELKSVTEDNRLLLLTQFWTIKEAAYKTFGKKGFDFREDIHISGGDFTDVDWKATAEVRKNDLEFHYSVIGKTENDFVLAICMEIP